MLLILFAQKDCDLYIHAQMLFQGFSIVPTKKGAHLAKCVLSQEACFKLISGNERQWNRVGKAWTLESDMSEFKFWMGCLLRVTI